MKGIQTHACAKPIHEFILQQIDAWTKWLTFCRRHFDCIFVNRNSCILNQSSLKFVRKDSMAWCRTDVKPLLETMLTQFIGRKCGSLNLDAWVTLRSGMYMYTGQVFCHHCACWWSGTKRCQTISTHSDDYKIREVCLGVTVVSMIFLVVTDQMISLKITIVVTSDFKCYESLVNVVINDWSSSSLINTPTSTPPTPPPHLWCFWSAPE